MMTQSYRPSDSNTEERVPILIWGRNITMGKGFCPERIRDKDQKTGPSLIIIDDLLDLSRIGNRAHRYIKKIAAYGPDG